MWQKIIQRLTRNKLRDRFILLFILLAVTPLLVLGSTALYLIDSSHRVDVLNLEVQLIAQLEERIESFLNETLDTMELRADIADASQGSIGIQVWQTFFAEGLLEENMSFEEVSFASPDGIEVVHLARYGNIVQRSSNVSQLLWFREALSGQTYIGDIYHTLHGPMVTMAAPVWVDGRVIQVISAEINISTLLESIDNARLGSTGYVVLLDSDGALVSDNSRFAQPLGTNFSSYERIARIVSGEVLFGLDKRNRYQSYFTDEAVVGVGKRIDETGWILLAEWPLTDADAVVFQVRKQVMLGTVISIIVVLLVAPLFANRLVRPIRALQRGAVQIEQGNFKEQVNITTHDELEELGNAFNRMSVGLERLEELRNEFVFIAAHELRAPVTAVRGYLSLIKEGNAGEVPAKINKFLKPVWQSNERLVQLVNDLLDIARSDAGKLKVDTVASDLGESVQAIIDEAKILAKEKHIELTYEKNADIPHVLMDSSRTKEVVMNLVSNAIKYNNKNGWVKVYHEIDNDMVVTHVEDNGFGLSEEDQKHMFEKFYRAEGENMKEIPGTGLGMFITQELVEKMGGKIWFRSNKGDGTRFSFSLKIA